jgi:hypothetical protein
MRDECRKEWKEPKAADVVEGWGCDGVAAARATSLAHTNEHGAQLASTFFVRGTRIMPSIQHRNELLQIPTLHHYI